MRLYLMKLPLTDWLEDQRALEGRSEQMLEALRAGTPADGDNSNRYLPTPEANRNIFRPRKIRS